MEYEKDFVKEDTVEFEIEGRKFKYKPTTAGDENEWLEEYMVIDEKGKPKQNFKKVNECKIRNLVSVPYDKELILKITGLNKDWKDLSKEEKWDLLKKLKPSTFSKIIRKMEEIDSPVSEEKKN